MLVELHTSVKKYKVFYEWLHAVSKMGFYLLHFEINEGNMNACEFTLMHESCFHDYGIEQVIGKIFS